MSLPEIAVNTHINDRKSIKIKDNVNDISILLRETEERIHSMINVLHNDILSSIHVTDEQNLSFNKLCRRYHESSSTLTTVFFSALDTLLFKSNGILDNSIENDLNNMSFQSQSFLEATTPHFDRRSSFRFSLLAEDTPITFMTNNDSKQYLIPVEIIKKYPTSLFYQFYEDEENRSPNGSIYIDHDDTYLDVIVNYMKNEELPFESYSYSQSVAILNDFQYYQLPFRMNLLQFINSSYQLHIINEWIHNYSLIINNKKDTLLVNYLLSVDKQKLEHFFKSIPLGQITFNLQEHSIETSITLHYLETFYEYIENQEISIEITKYDEYVQLNKEWTLFDLSLPSSFNLNTILSPFNQSTVLQLDTNNITISIYSWFLENQLNNPWALSFRASEHEFDAKSFHDCCDNRGESIVLIRCVNHKNQVCIFGTYTSVGWMHPYQDHKDAYYIPDDNAYLFTLENPHHIPPTRYNTNQSNNKVICYDSSRGPCFWRAIWIDTQCNHHKNSFVSSYLNTSYDYEESLKSSLFVNTGKPEEYNYFNVSDYEVYTRQQ
ncbi:hypothetical protein WA158_002893 [Blastocystis sp. Blastoise]